MKTESARTKVASELFYIQAYGYLPMKLRSSRRKTTIAFTLVELLVVIGIIAILASVVVASVGTALRFAKRTKANAMCVQIQTAIQSYYSEYGVYPTATTVTTDDFYTGGTSASDTSGGAKWKNLTIALCGNVDPYLGSAATSTVSNTRNISYLAPTRSDLDTTSHTLQNPFGSSSTAPYFFMVVDTDYSGVVGDTSSTKLPDFSGTNYTGIPLANGTPGGVAVWCSCDQPLTGGTAAKPSNPSFWAHSY